jgi:hypothetical protein
VLAAGTVVTVAPLESKRMAQSNQKQQQNLGLEVVVKGKGTVSLQHR